MITLTGYTVLRVLCGSHQEAEDLVQDTFARVLRKPRFLHSHNDVGYLLRVLRNTFVRAKRFAGRRPEYPVLLDEMASVGDVSAAGPAARLEYSELYRAIASLPGRFRDALIAVDVMGCSYGEGARAFRVREATITSRLHPGRQRLADTLTDEADIAPMVRTSAPAPRVPGTQHHADE